MIAEVHGWLPTTLAFTALAVGVVLWFVAVAWTVHLQLIIDPPPDGPYPHDDDWMVIFLLIWPLVLPVLLCIVAWRRWRGITTETE